MMRFAACGNAAKCSPTGALITHGAKYLLYMLDVQTFN